MGKSVTISVTNDISTDQRVLRSAAFLHHKNYQVTIIGRKRKDSLPVPDLAYRFIRMRLLFNKGPLFYAEYNLRLFLVLLSLKKTHLFSNDLDTLLPNYLAHVVQPKTRIIYDAHEYFTGVPELSNRPFVQKIWKMIEKTIIPKLGKMITVNTSIAALYHKDYGQSVKVIRNIGKRPSSTVSRPADLPDCENLIILQGAGINIDRGGEEAILAMQYLDNYHLMIVGSGDAIDTLQKMRSEHQLEDRITFYGKKPYVTLLAYTQAAKVGLSLDKPSNINYQYSLPNKIFDYIHSHTAVVASNLIEIKRIVEDYNVGYIVKTHDPKMIAEAIKKAVADYDRKIFEEGFRKAKETLTWEKESRILDEFFE